MPATISWKDSIQPTRVSAKNGPKVDWEISNTRNITTAKIGMPSHRLVRTASILSWKFLSLVKTLRVSTSVTILFTNSKRFLSAASTSALSRRLISSCSYGAFCCAPFKAAAAFTTSDKPLSPAAVDTVSMTGQPNLAANAETSIFVSFLALISLLFRATTTGIPSSRS